MTVSFDTRKYDVKEAFRRAKARFLDEKPMAKVFSILLRKVTCHHGRWAKGAYFSWEFKVAEGK